MASQRDLRPEAEVPNKPKPIVSAPPVMVDRLLTRLKYTPDFGELRFYPKIPLFIYDDIMRDGTYHYLLEGAEFLGKGYTLAAYFKMKDNVSNPVVFQYDASEDNRAHIRGEVFNVNVEMLNLVDREMGNNKKFDRTIHKIQLEDQKPNAVTGVASFRRLPWIQSFIYLGRKEYWDTTGGLRPRGARRNMRQDFPLGDRSYYEWDSWERDWPDEEAYGGRPFNAPFNEDYGNTGINVQRHYKDRHGNWHPLPDRSNVHIG